MSSMYNYLIEKIKKQWNVLYYTWWGFVSITLYVLMRFRLYHPVCPDEVLSLSPCMSWWGFVSIILYVLMRFRLYHPLCLDEVLSLSPSMSWWGFVSITLYFLMRFCLYHPLCPDEVLSLSPSMSWWGFCSCNFYLPFSGESWLDRLRVLVKVWMPIIITH